MKNSGKILIIVLVVLVVLIGLLIYFVIKDLKTESKLKEEIYSYRNDIVQNKTVDINITTTGDYAKVEKAIKTYLNDCNQHYNNLNNILNGESNDILSIQNIQTDLPSFTNTKQYISDYKTNINNAKTTYLNDFDDDKIKSYIDNESVSDYYKDFYYKLVTNEDVIISDKNEFNDRIDKILNKLNIQEEIINFLITNQTKWRISNNQIIFYDPALTETYNNYVNELNNIN